MRLIKVGIANINPTVGAFTSNKEKIILFARGMADEKCTIGVFSEQIIGGYPPEDLVQWKNFREGQQCALDLFVSATASFSFPTVFVLGMVVEHRGEVYNAAIIVCDGKVHGIVPKEKLPTYGVFYEGRTLSCGIPEQVETTKNGIPFGDMIFEAPFGVFAVEVCEDIWTPDGPMRRRAFSGAELVVNISASPFRIGVVNTRREMIATRAADNQVTLVYANQVGGNDSLVFDGGGLVNQNGQSLFEAPRFRETMTTQVVDLDRTRRMRMENSTWRMDAEEYRRCHRKTHEIIIPDGPSFENDIYVYPFPKQKSFFLPKEAHINTREEFFDDMVESLIMGLDYYVKTRAFRKIGIALSGGKDSALTLILAWIFAKRLRNLSNVAATKNFINCFAMPTKFNTVTTRNIARDLAEELQVSFQELSIEGAYVSECKATQEMCVLGRELPSATLQNIQARIRAERMWNWTNAEGGLWLQTGNMSEKAVGYTTIGGDLSGGYSLLGNLPKTVVIELLRFLGEKYSLQSVEKLLKTKASAELRDDQEDERDLMPFPVLDACLALFVGEKLSPKEMYLAVRSMWTDEEFEKMYPGFERIMVKQWVKHFVYLFNTSIFKWVQAPQSVHVGTLDLDRERALQLPVVQSREWLEKSLHEIDSCEEG